MAFQQKIFISQKSLWSKYKQIDTSWKNLLTKISHYTVSNSQTHSDVILSKKLHFLVHAPLAHTEGVELPCSPLEKDRQAFIKAEA